MGSVVSFGDSSRRKLAGGRTPELQAIGSTATSPEGVRAIDGMRFIDGRDDRGLIGGSANPAS
jgi:hypothetical protein